MLKISFSDEGLFSECMMKRCNQTKASGVAAPFWDPPIWLRRVLDGEVDRKPFLVLALSTESSSLYPRRSCTAMRNISDAACEVFQLQQAWRDDMPARCTAPHT